MFVAGAGVEHDPNVRALYTYGFGTSAYKRLRYEAKFTANVHGASSAFVQRIQQAAAWRSKARRTTSPCSVAGTCT